MIDAIMGSGKTSAMLSYINSHPEENFIFITPFLSEVARVKDAVFHPIYEPVNRGEGKFKNLKQLLAMKRSVVATHSLFLKADTEIKDLVRDGEYTLVLDEVLNVIAPYNSVCEDPQKLMERGDPHYLLDKGSITIDSNGVVTWLDGDDYNDFKYSEVEGISKSGNLLCVDENQFLWQFPPRVFTAFKRVYVLTYLFEGSVLRCYFDYFGLQYQLATVKCTDGNYAFTEHVNNQSERVKFKELINVNGDEKLNNIGKIKNALSKSWYVKARKDSIKQLQKNINVFLKNRTRASSSEVMWTAFKDDRDRLAGQGYKYIRKLTAADKKLPDQEKTKLCCFVACNSRATNDFAKRTVLMYLINRYPDPSLIKHFAKKDVHFDADMFALNELLQWIWRSAIRNGQAIQIYIPSSRMRRLLQNWLDGA